MRSERWYSLSKAGRQRKKFRWDIARGKGGLGKLAVGGSSHHEQARGPGAMVGCGQL